MAKHIYKGIGAPSFTPLQIGHHYIDTESKIQYVSVGVESKSDWAAAPTEALVSHTRIKDIGLNTHTQIDSHISNLNNPHSLTKSQIGLSNVDNTSDALKPVSSATQMALNNKEDKANKNIASGYAGLGADGKINASQLPAIAITDSFLVGSATEQTSLQVQIGDVAVRTDLSKSFILKTEPSSVLANWVELLSPTSPVQSVNGKTGAVVLIKSDVGLGSVDNTSDALKPISTPTQTALDAKVLGPALSVDSELALFSGVTGKIIKRAAGTGIVRIINGVLSLAGVNLTADVSGVLPEANGGTNMTQAYVPIATGFDTVFNTPDGVETTVVSKNIFHSAGNSHQLDGNVIKFYASGTIGAGLSTTKRIRLYWGAFVIYNSQTIPTTNAGHWYVEGVIMRTGLNTQKAMVKLTTSAAINFHDTQIYPAGEFTNSGASTFRIAITGSNADTVSIEMYKILRGA